MSELSPAARELLAAAREQMAPDAEAIARMRAGIAVTVGKTAAVGAGTSLALKLGLVSIVAAVAIGGTLLATHAPTEVAPRVEFPVERSAPAALVITQPVEAAPAAGPVAPVPEIQPPRTRVAPRADLAREVALIDQAMTALRGGKPAEALAAIRLHAVETRGQGQLAEDAAAIEIEAACRLHDPTVAAKLAAFDERYPTSAQRSQLPTQCK
ncbi:MAG: hypothetical protein SFX73_32815 [Kofleriaceae bacterium]|nr:hypothetical protein [Kofleriaceae bacterium]